MRSYLILTMCGLFLIQYFIPSHWLQYLVVGISLLAFIGSAVNADSFPRMLGLLMMGIGIIIEFNKGDGLDGISKGILLILPLLCLITLAPLLSLPLRLGGYFETIAFLLRNLLYQPKKLYAGITGTLFLLSPILNLGSVRIINEFLKDLKLPPAMSAKSYLVGFSTSVMWSPYFASVSLVLYYLKVPFNDYIIYGIGLSLLSLLVGNLLFYIWERRHPLCKDSIKEVNLEKGQRNQLIKLILFVLMLMTTCLIVESITHWSMVVIVCLFSVIVPLLYGLLTKTWREIIPQLVDFRDHTVPMMNNEIMLFMSAGLLGYAMKGTEVANQIGSLLTILAHQSFLLFAIAIMIIVLAVTYIGIHQIAAVGALAMQLNAQDLGISNLALAMLLLLTWSISTALSPFSGLNLMVSRFVGISGIGVGLRSNGLHVSIVAILGIVVISFIG
ncbi:hypothetical protein [Priestia megaterium]|uniref:hypothetical protein n=1 Tax=Priestia megaterium TaxID=1404 RepID=UPI00285CC79C|nr:hypothetical protein [Priestia megaterium]MDR7245832.1 hypothetical protein [Priestia megaterium]